MRIHSGVALGVKRGDRIMVGPAWYTVREIEFYDGEDGITIIKFYTSLPKVNRARIEKVFNWEFKVMDTVKYQTSRNWEELADG